MSTFRQAEEFQNEAARQLSHILRDHMRRYGYREIDTPIIEKADLFLTRAGDRAIQKLFTFERPGHQLALRPEFTASAARRYIRREADGAVVRWQFYGPIFEDAPAQTAQNCQRLSAGAELIGMPGAAADAEIIGMAARGLTAGGLRGWRLAIGHVGLMRQLLSHYDIDPRTERFLLQHVGPLSAAAAGKADVRVKLDRLLAGRTAQKPPDGSRDDHADYERSTQQILDALLDPSARGDTMGGRTRGDIARRLQQKYHRALRRDQIEAALDFLAAWSRLDDTPDRAFRQIEELTDEQDDARALLAEWRAALRQLDEIYEIPADCIRIRPALARNWDYYTGVVFELWSADGRHLGGGGRYDELTRLIGGSEPVPAVGFAYYLDEFLTALPHPPSTSSSPMVIGVDDGDGLTAARWAQALRRHGIDVALMPAAQIDPGQPALRLDERGGALFDGETYPPALAAALAEAIKRTFDG